MNNDEMRREFEAWLLKDCGIVSQPDERGEYRDASVQRAWLSWQAATRRALPDGFVAVPTHKATDSARLDALERMANQMGGILLHDGSETGRCGIGLRPGTVIRGLREAIDATMAADMLSAAASATTDEGTGVGG
ncbi:MAG: hypothetical protein ABFE07_25345 [Armatimonadia bacterium]